MENIAQKVKKDKHLKKLRTALEKADLEYVLEEKGPYTVFAPTDKAFGKMSEKDLSELLGNKKKLEEVLKYHIIQGKYSSQDILNMKDAKTMSGKKIKISTKDGVKVNDSKVTEADIESSNGIIHFIDAPLMPKMIKKPW